MLELDSEIVEEGVAVPLSTSEEVADEKLEVVKSVNVFPLCDSEDVVVSSAEGVPCAAVVVVCETEVDNEEVAAPLPVSVFDDEANERDVGEEVAEGVEAFVSVGT